MSEVEHTRYNIVYKPDNKSKKVLAEEVAKIICEDYEKVIIERIVRENYSLLDEYEKKLIIDEAVKVSEEDKANGDFPGRKAREEIVKEELLNYLSENEFVIPCGFVDFRYRDLYFYARQIVEEGAKRFFDKQEYEEFINLLSMFVASREKKEELIHVIWSDDTVYLYNKRGRDVTGKYQKEFLNIAKKKDLNSEDLAISAIIAASPETLILHNPPMTPLSEALKRIYEGRVKICTGCRVCKKVEFSEKS